MREIVLDLETTGLSPKTDRIIQIGVVELAGYVPTGREKEWYIYPQCSVEGMEASAIHGLTDEFLRDKPLFSQVVEEFLRFIGDTRLVIHNAPFDTCFLNAELSRLGLNPIPASQTLDTLPLALTKFPRSKCTLEALCHRFGIRVVGHHNALSDARLLAQCYLELQGGPQMGFNLSTQMRQEKRVERIRRVPRTIEPTREEIKAHAELVSRLSNPVWKDSGNEDG